MMILAGTLPGTEARFRNENSMKLKCRDTEHAFETREQS